MASYNKVILIGNLTRDPELRVTPKGTAICQFGIAVNRTWKDESGQSREEVSFIDIEAWGKAGETITKFLLKGSSIMLDGRLKQDSWEDKQTGQKRSKLKVVVENFQFLGDRRSGESNTEDNEEPPAPRQTQERHTSGPRGKPPADGSAYHMPSDIDEDVPF
jgi:single-strand DNA-binding protein